MRPSCSIPFPAIEKHGIIGDRRTAALVAADGTLDWLCLPDYDSGLAFGALLDFLKGGYWRFGPGMKSQGQQRYVRDSILLETAWKLETGDVVLTDAMLWPETDRAPGRDDARVVLRRLRCTRGKVLCRTDLNPGYNCSNRPFPFSKTASGFKVNLPKVEMQFWASFPVRKKGSSLHGKIELNDGEESWNALAVGRPDVEWSPETADRELKKALQYWRDWLKQLHPPAREHEEIRRTALLVHLLNYAPTGSVVAAPTTSLPERIGGTWNSDYRLSWVRDTSLALGMLARLGDWQNTEGYLQWLVRRQSLFGQPLQVLYEVRGGKHPKPSELTDAYGYRRSQPVRIGNHAYKQYQLGSFGFLADCFWQYLQEGGSWRDDYWRLIRRCANYVSDHWNQPDNGIWELSVKQHYVHSKVLCWVMLDRAIRIAQKVCSSFKTKSWEAERSKIHQEVMQRGWSEKLGSFRQHYESDNLDAAELLISVLGFLPGDHPRVLATIDRISESLSIEGFVYRFDPLETSGVDQLPLGQMEGAFLPCTFWLATACAKAGRIEKARSILETAEKVSGKTGLFAEAIDPRTGSFLGNTPLLFSHVEYARAKLELLLQQQKRSGK